jgi:hypothetical protein
MANRRSDLPDRERAVSDTLDELNHAMHGLTASWAYPIEFLEMLAERGFTVIPRRDAQALKTLQTILDCGVAPSEWATPWRERAERSEAEVDQLNIDVAAARRDRDQVRQRAADLEQELRRQISALEARTPPSAASIIADLKRAAIGRREYAKNLKPGQWSRKECEAEADVLDMAVKIAEGSKLTLLGIIPIASWADDEAKE